MKLEKQVKELVVFQAISIIARLFYFFGLTALIPLLPLVLTPNQLVDARYAFGIALGSIILGFALVFYFSKTRKIALRVLGLFTLIPGLLAVIVSFAGPRRMGEFLSMFGKISPLLQKYIDSYVPKAWLIAGIYIILGVALIWFGEKARK